MKATKVIQWICFLALGAIAMLMFSFEGVAFHHTYKESDHVTAIELAVGAGSFAQILAVFTCIPLLFWRKELVLSRRSWAIYCLSMIFILVRRSLSIYGMMGYERMIFAEMITACGLSLSYITFQGSILYDTFQWYVMCKKATKGQG